MKAIERIKQYIDFKGINNSFFEKKTDLSNGYIATQFKRNADLGEGVLNKILDNCLDIDPEWLLTGTGSMLKKEIDPPEVVDEINYKELAEARLEIIDGLKFKISVLETQLSQTKSATVFVPDFERELVK